MKRLNINPYQSPIGLLDVIFDEDALVFLDFAENHERTSRLLTRRYGQIEFSCSNSSTSIHDALDVYFNDGGDPFSGIHLDTGGTSFQRSVWKALRRTTPGRTMDYTTLARRAGKPRAIRAVASCNARNPIAIIIPCHRIIGRDGSLRGYAGGSERKRWLIEHEHRCLVGNKLSP